MSEPTSSHPCDPDTNAPFWARSWSCPSCGWPYDLVTQYTEVKVAGIPIRVSTDVWQRRVFA